MLTPISSKSSSMEITGKLSLCVFVTVLLTFQVYGATDFCALYVKSCVDTKPKTSTATNLTFCLENGQKYVGLCAYYNALCRNSSLVISATGVNCERKIHHRTTTTPRPLSYFEINLFHAISRSIDDKLELSKARGITPAKAKPIFSKQDHTNKVYVRNPDCWAYGLDLTAISPWNSNHGIRKAGTLISKRHLLWARHYNIPVGTTMRFITLNNTVVERKIAKTTLVNHTSHDKFWGKDIVVGMLDQDVPDEISFAKVMPKDLDEFRPSYNTRLPVMSTDFQEHAIVTDFSYYRNTGIGLRVPAVDSIEHEYYETKIVGDSGNPSFFIINDELILLFVFTSGGAGGGTSINHYYDEINRIMKAEGSDYQLTPFNLNGFEMKNHHYSHLIG